MWLLPNHKQVTLQYRYSNMLVNLFFEEVEPSDSELTDIALCVQKATNTLHRIFMVEISLLWLT